MSARKGEEGKQDSDDEPGPSGYQLYRSPSEERQHVVEGVSSSAVPGPSHQSSLVQRGSRPYEQSLIPVPPPPLRVKRPGRPRIHPPKPAGISKPRGRPRGSKNKKPRKKVIERPPKRPRGRPRKWPREMWEGFQRSQATVVSHHLQHQHLQKQQMPQQDMPGPSHMYYEEQMPLHHQSMEESAPPLSHLPIHLMQQEPQMGHPSTSHMQHIPQMPLHHQEEMLHPQQMALMQQQYLQEQQQHPTHEQHIPMHLRQQPPHLFPPDEHSYYPEQHPPHTTS